MRAAHAFARPVQVADPSLDEELVGRVLAGESDAYEVLVRRYQARLYRHALGMVLDGDVAADLVQDAFVNAFRRLDRCRDRSSFGTWIFRILRNRCLDYLKERRRKDLPLDDHHDLEAVGDGPESNFERSVLGDVIERALGQLPETQREAFLLKHVHDLTYEEIAEVVGASESALRMRVLRAREMLQTLLGEELGAPAGGM
jgi:RNA polymerase sigma-70 factor, ECF subfamily